jgi:hypothetical protein
MEGNWLPKTARHLRTWDEINKIIELEFTAKCRSFVVGGKKHAVLFEAFEGWRKTPGAGALQLFAFSCIFPLHVKHGA